ncbi:MAG: hypothetical protein WCK49_07855, partial [Myxococcaceae bacterium]
GFLQTGLHTETAGIWMSDDPVFDKTPIPLSEKAQQQLFGTTKLDRSQWSVGYASLRDKNAQLNWMDLRLHSVPLDKHCSLVLSSSMKVGSNDDQNIHDLAIRHQFTDCIIVERDGSERKLSLKPSWWQTLFNQNPVKRTLRIVRSFIDEADLAAVIQQGSDGCIGASGDTSFARSLTGKYPPFIENRRTANKMPLLIGAACDYFKNAQYPLLAKWFDDLLTQSVTPYTPSRNPYSEDLMAEWQRFQQQDLPRLDMAPWFDLYVRRCAYAHRANVSKSNAFLAVESKYRPLSYETKPLSEAERISYEAEMKPILEQLA